MTDESAQLKITLNTPESPSRKRSANAGGKPAKKTSEETDTMQETTTKPVDFETMLTELELVVAKLEGELKLEEAMALFERGLGLSQDCQKFLKAAQQRVEVLKRTAGGGVQAEAFSEETEPVS
jgi:exodeoxyribonuclease VII small subunit